MAETTKIRMDFLKDLYDNNIPIGDDKEALLVKYSYIKKIGVKSENYIEPAIHTPQRSYKKVSPGDINDRTILEYKKFESIKQNWLPYLRNPFDPSPEFVKWIDSINYNFKNRLEYPKFNAYVRQAQE